MFETVVGNRRQFITCARLCGWKETQKLASNCSGRFRGIHSACPCRRIQSC